jgi:hypothetical protein
VYRVGKADQPGTVYLIHGEPDERSRDHGDTVRALEAAGLITQHRHGRITPTDEGKQAHVEQPAGCGMCPQHLDGLDWLLAKVRDGTVGIYPDGRYYISPKTGPKPKPGDEPILCDDEIHLLAEAGLVVLEDDGPVSLPWRLREGNNRGGLGGLVAAAQKAPPKALDNDLFLAPNIQAVA